MIPLTDDAVNNIIIVTSLSLSVAIFGLLGPLLGGKLDWTKWINSEAKK